VALIGLLFDPSAAINERVREALALSIDRATIHTVLLQRQGVPTGAVLPQWLSGYAFLFPSGRDLDKARELAAGGSPVTIGYDPADATARLLTERIAVNAREAGITVRPTPGSSAAARIIRMSVSSADPSQALESIREKMNFQAAGTLYAVESAMIRSHLIIPLFHVPEIYGLGPRVRGWAPSRWGGWNLESIWLAP
jgi:peptide/nickel transport system substrate-binding protein